MAKNRQSTFTLQLLGSRSDTGGRNTPCAAGLWAKTRGNRRERLGATKGPIKRRRAIISDLREKNGIVDEVGKVASTTQRARIGGGLEGEKKTHSSPRIKIKQSYDGVKWDVLQ